MERSSGLGRPTDMRSYERACHGGNGRALAMTEEKRYDVFLSHNSDDKSLVKELALHLQDEAGLDSGLDAWHISFGGQDG